MNPCQDNINFKLIKISEFVMHKNKRQYFIAVSVLAIRSNFKVNKKLN